MHSDILGIDIRNLAQILMRTLKKLTKITTMRMKERTMRKMMMKRTWLRVRQV